MSLEVEELERVDPWLGWHASIPTEANACLPIECDEHLLRSSNARQNDPRDRTSSIIERLIFRSKGLTVFIAFD